MSKRCVVRMVGPLTPYSSEFERELLSCGYTDLSTAELLRLMAHLSRWLAKVGLEPEELIAERVDVFVSARRAAGHTNRLTVRSLGPMLEFLRGQGAVPLPPQPGPVNADERLLERYRMYLVSERGLVEKVVLRFVGTASVFLAEHAGFGDGATTLTARDVTAFCSQQLPTRGRAAAGNLGAGLRSFLRFLHVEGLVDAPLAQAVPRVANRKDKGLPRWVPPETVGRLLKSCDRRTRRGRRDYTILLILARLGLRAGEVAGLLLDDIDWRAGEILVRGKGNRDERLPLPDDVGAALAAHLRRSRPPAATRTVFLRAIAPAVGLTPAAISWVVYDACERAGVQRLSAHQLRHTCATSMMRRGASLVEIGQVLRHSAVGTTSIYAKVDFEALRSLALPWPGGAA